MAKQATNLPPVSPVVVYDNGEERGVFTALRFRTPDGSPCTEVSSPEVSSVISVNVGSSAPPTRLVVEEEGVPVVSPATVMNFVGSGVTVTDAGSGQADVTVDAPSIVVESDGIPVVPTASTLDFVGTKVDSPALNVARVTPAVVYTNGSGTDDVRTSRAQPNAIDPTKTGITALGSDTSGGEPGALANFATICGGDRCSALGIASTSSGLSSNAAGRGSVAIGEACLAVSSWSTALGHDSSATGDGSLAVGLGSLTQGAGATALGNSSAAIGQGSTAIGNGTVSRAVGATALCSGCEVAAGGQGSLAEGSFTKCWSASSHAEGEDCYTFGFRSHAEGEFVESWGLGSHAEGRSTRAFGSGAHAEGLCSVASRDGQHAIAAGNLSNLDDASVAAGDAQTSEMVLRARTPGLAPGETALFLYGMSGTQPFETERNRSYTLTLTVTVTGRDVGGAQDFVQTIVRRVTVLNRGSGTVVADTLVSDQGTFVPGSIAVTVDNPLGNITLDNGLLQLRANASMRLEFTETTYPITTPLDIPGVTNWVSAEGLAPGALASWPDQSGSGTDYAQAIAASQPTVVAASIGGLPAVSFDGLASFMTMAGVGKTLADLVSAGEYTAMAVVRWNVFGPFSSDRSAMPAALTDSLGVWGLSAGGVNGIAVGWQSDAPATFQGSQAVVNVGVATVQSWYELALVLPGTSTFVRLEVAQQHDNGATSNPIYDTSGVPRLGVNFDGTVFAAIDVGEVVVWNRTLTQTERELAFQYLKDKWGL